MIGKRVAKPACPGLGAGVVVKRSRPNARVWWKVKWDALPSRAPTTEHQNNLEVIDMQRWVFYANSDWTETALTAITGAVPPERFDVDGRQFSFVHVFEAEDWDQAKLQIARLRYGSVSRKIASDFEQAQQLLRRMPSQAPEGSADWEIAMDAVLNTFMKVRSS